jgi:hypothetical protein
MCYQLFVLKSVIYDALWQLNHKKVSRFWSKNLIVYNGLLNQKFILNLICILCYVRMKKNMFSIYFTTNIPYICILIQVFIPYICTEYKTSEYFFGIWIKSLMKQLFSRFWKPNYKNRNKTIIFYSSWLRKLSNTTNLRLHYKACMYASGQQLSSIGLVEEIVGIEN